MGGSVKLQQTFLLTVAGIGGSLDRLMLEDHSLMEGQ
jgi:hypothetical protein